MNIKRKEKSVIDVIFIISVFGVFIVSALLVVLFGARIYKKTVSDMDKNYSSRTALAYISENINQHDYKGGVEIELKDGTPFLRLHELSTTDEYSTYIYSDDGYLKELTIKDDVEFTPTVGKEILKVRNFTATKESDSLYRFNIIDSYDTEMVFYVSLYCNTLGGEMNE